MRNNFLAIAVIILSTTSAFANPTIKDLIGKYAGSGIGMPHTPTCKVVIDRLPSLERTRDEMYILIRSDVGARVLLTTEQDLLSSISGRALNLQVQGQGQDILNLSIQLDENNLPDKLYLTNRVGDRSIPLANCTIKETH